MFSQWKVSVLLSPVGFDPWDVSKQGLADLLETEGIGREEGCPDTVNGGTEEKAEEEEREGEVVQTVPLDSSSWQDELRALFPTVNISFGGKYRNINVLGTSMPS